MLMGTDGVPAPTPCLGGSAGAGEQEEAVKACNRAAGSVGLGELGGSEEVTVPGDWGTSSSHPAAGVGTRAVSRARGNRASAAVEHTQSWWLN